MKKIFILFSILSFTAFVACKKEEKAPVTTPSPSPTPAGGSVNLEFANMVGNQPLVFNTGYKVMGGDSFRVTKFNYYITNVKLIKDDNSIYSEPNSYHLLEHSNPASTLINLANVPTGSYKSVSFQLGVDSALNVSGAKPGDLDPINGMFWSWNSGYIMLKFEGSSPVSTASNKGLVFHVGGFSGVNKVQRTITINLGSTTANVNNSTPKIKVSADAMDLFVAPNAISFATLNTVHMPGTNAKLIADNYANMFSLISVTN